MFSFGHSSRRRLLRLFVASAVLLLLGGTAVFDTLASQASTKTESSSKKKTTGRSSAARRARTTSAKKHDTPCGIATIRVEKKGDDSTIVKLEVRIDEQGKVVSTYARSGREVLRKRADEEARQMKFEPTTLSGTPVSYFKNLVFDYTEKENKPKEL